MRPARSFPLLLVLATLGGCTSDDMLRIDGVTAGAGEAQAANTALQMVDPWGNRVADTRLRVPAERPKPQASGGAAADAAATSDTDASGG